MLTLMIDVPEAEVCPINIPALQPEWTRPYTANTATAPSTTAAQTASSAVPQRPMASAPSAVASIPNSSSSSSSASAVQPSSQLSAISEDMKLMSRHFSFDSVGTPSPFTYVAKLLDHVPCQPFKLYFSVPSSYPHAALEWKLDYADARVGAIIEQRLRAKLVEQVQKRKHLIAQQQQQQQGVSSSSSSASAAVVIAPRLSEILTSITNMVTTLDQSRQHIQQQQQMIMQQRQQQQQQQQQPQQPQPHQHMPPSHSMQPMPVAAEVHGMH